MSTIGKISVIVALIAGLAALGLTFVMKPKQQELKDNLASTTQDLQQKTGELASTKKELSTTQASLDETKTELATTKSDLETAKLAQEKAETRANEADAKVTDLTAQIASKDEKIAEYDKKIAEAGAPIEEMKAKIEDLNKQVAVIEGEKKQLADKVKQQEAEIADLKGVDGKVVLPAGLKGKVIVYNKSWNFVVIDLGRKDGALESGELTVFRNMKYVGRVKISAVNTKLCIANVLPEWSKLDLQPGDTVIPAS